MVKSDRWIIRMAKRKRMIIPFAEKQLNHSVISYGVSSYGYDMRLTDEFLVPRKKRGVIDPKKFDPSALVQKKGNSCVISPNSFILGRSMEYFRIPRDVLVICFGKSSYARCGIIVNVTPFEPEWEGYATISICNASPFSVRVHAREGIAQIIFLGASEPCKTSYADKKGRYQKQKKITLPK